MDLMSSLLSILLDSSKLKDFADDNFEFDKNGSEFSKRVENTVRKEEIARYEQFLLFPQCLKKTCTADTLKQWLAWERVNIKMGLFGIQLLRHYFLRRILVSSYSMYEKTIEYGQYL